ncbi:DUF2637 domain-containing protein [Streptomyces caniscabiei]|uniref:DUF2637 domain-containing protein n=1 Tax=Streptomyces caniscabiei TaxID=2746961 RepID=UPI001872302F|nr:DUF2637 domain-containing protein [Streptomyces caniscabiei]MBE4789936.1 DUF2637 domain-containing protein [Streptomyces caniscabiei]MBE4799728.1 DUF2637 domain-containing protein [Streptomyces caniscabiei]
MKWNPSRALAIAAGLVIVALTAAAFWLSYAHLAEVALAHGMEGKEVRAWAWPATLDLFIVAGELLMLRAALAGKVDPWAIGLTVVGSGSSIALNVAGVGTSAGTLDYVVAAVPPAAALLAFGALMRQIHQALAGRDDQNFLGPQEVPTPEVTVERVDDDQPPALTEAPEVVPADARMLPIVALPAPKKTFVFDHSRQQYMPSGSTNGYVDWPSPEEPTVVTGPDEGRSSDRDDEKGYASVPTPSGDHDRADEVTTSVGAETPRQVVTEVVTLTPSELRRRASKLNRELVTSTNRPVTIERLREEYGLSRREAAELRREVVGTVALVPGEVRS